MCFHFLDSADTWNDIPYCSWVSHNGHGTLSTIYITFPNNQKRIPKSLIALPNTS